MKIGFIGLGNVGGNLAGSLLRNGHDLTVRDLDIEAAKPFLDRGANWAESPAQMAAAVDIVITCLPSPAASAEVMESPDGVLAGLSPLVHKGHAQEVVEPWHSRSGGDQSLVDACCFRVIPVEDPQEGRRTYYVLPRFGGDTDLSPHRHIHRMELAEHHRLEIDLDRRLLGVIPVWLLKLAPNTSKASDSFISQLAIGVPLRPRTPPANA